MGKITKDIAVTGSAKELMEYLLDEILPHPTTGVDCRITEANFTVSCFRCMVCGRELAKVLRSEEGEIHHLPINPCTRVVLGIHPDVRKKEEERFGREISFGKEEALYICAACTGLKIPERICNSEVKELAGRLHQDPIADMRGYNPNEGCWITVTEFPLNGRTGRFMNLQTNFRRFVIILGRTNLVSGRDINRLPPLL